MAAGSLELDATRHVVRVAGKLVDLTPRDQRPKGGGNDRDVRRFQDRNSGGGSRPSAPSGPSWFDMAQKKKN